MRSNPPSSLAPPTDAELVERFRHFPSEKDAVFRLLYERHASAILAVAIRMGCTDPEDVVQTVFEQFYVRDFHVFDATKGSLRGFLCKNANWKSVSVYRSNKRRSQAEEYMTSDSHGSRGDKGKVVPFPPVGAPGPDQQFADAQELLRFREVLPKLPARPRDILATEALGLDGAEQAKAREEVAASHHFDVNSWRVYLDRARRSFLSFIEKNSIHLR